MDLALRDTVVLVTGAGQGLGRAIGLAFAREGAQVAFHYHSSADGAHAAATQRKPFLASTPADWAPQVDVTVTGTVRVTHAVARRMAERRAGASRACS